MAADFSGPSKPMAKPAAQPVAPPMASLPAATVLVLADLARAATAFRDSYAQHLNHHCEACTKAWAELNAALEAIPPR